MLPAVPEQIRPGLGSANIDVYRAGAWLGASNAIASFTKIVTLYTKDTHLSVARQEKKLPLGKSDRLVN